MSKYIWLPGDVVKDRLSRREVMVYSVIKYAIISIFMVLAVLVFVLESFAPEYWHSLPVMLLGVPAWVFGLALKTDTRVIHGISWLRGSAKEPVHKSDLLK